MRNPSDYRTEIDGLRAVAVLLVVANHAKYSFFQGGFIGVDVFFVISGYLITRIILGRELNKTFSIGDFYLRRIRRIIPALLLMLLICLPVAYWLMLPNELVDFGKATVGAVFFFSNLVLWRQGGYFDVDADLKPLLHLWSLAVEEQFYLGFPLVLLIGLRIRRRILAISLWALLLGSLLLMFALHVDMPRASFYLLPTRAWEILVGAVVALGEQRRQSSGRNPSRSQVFPAIGLITILSSALLLDQTTRFPGAATLFPVLGTALVLSGDGSRSWVSNLLNWRPLQVIGLASFSIYLWHQPLLVFGRLLSADYLSGAERDGIVLLTLIIGVTSWHFVEKPFRSSARARTPIVLLAVTVASLLVSAAAVVFVREGGFIDRLPPSVAAHYAKPNRELVCRDESQEWIDEGLLRSCAFGDLTGTRTVFLVGDSHADALIPFLNQEFALNDIRGIRVLLSECSEVPGSYWRGEVPDNLTFCEQVHEQLLATIKKSRAKTILSVRWNFRLFPIPGEIDRLEATNSEGGHAVEDYREYVIANSKGSGTGADVKSLALLQLFAGLLEASERLFIIGQVPEIAWNINRINFTYYRARGEVLDQLSIPRSDFEERSRFINGVIEDFKLQNPTPRLSVVSPADSFCDTFVEGRCVAQWQGIPFYSDDDHVSYEGAKLIFESVDW